MPWTTLLSPISVEEAFTDVVLASGEMAKVAQAIVSEAIATAAAFRPIVRRLTTNLSKYIIVWNAIKASQTPSFRITRP